MTATTISGSHRRNEPSARVTSIGDPHSELVVTSSLDIGVGGQPDAAMVLRAFDELRREVALQVDGQVGMGVGYALLDISWSRLRGVGPKDRVALSATLLSRRPGRHEVAYVASVLPAAPENPDTSPTVIVRARGWTLSRKTETEKKESR